MSTYNALRHNLHKSYDRLLSHGKFTPNIAYVVEEILKLLVVFLKKLQVVLPQFVIMFLMAVIHK